LINKKTPSRGVLNGLKTGHFLQALFSLFSCFEQSIFPPPWLPANAGADKTMNAEMIAVIANFIGHL